MILYRIFYVCSQNTSSSPSFLSLNNNNNNNQTDIVSFEIHVRFSNQQQHRISILKLYILYYICGESLLGCPKNEKKNEKKGYLCMYRSFGTQRRKKGKMLKPMEIFSF